MSKTSAARRPALKDLAPPYAALVRALMKGKGGTALQLKERLGCSKPTVYARLSALRENGYRFKEERVRDGAKGPLAVRYSLPR